MKYRHMVLFDGVIYPAGSDVPEDKGVAVEQPPISEEPVEVKRKGRPKKVEE